MIHLEWDEVKADKNLRKHGISFEEAGLAFEDPFAISAKGRIVDGEQRWETIGLIKQGMLVFVVHISAVFLDDEYIRLISARQADKKEARRYARKIEH